MRNAERRTQSFSCLKRHIWVRTRNGVVVVGVTDYLKEQLGTVINVEFSGDRFVEEGCPIAWLESISAVIAVLSPMDCEVIEVNERLIREPWLVNTSPYDEGWLASLRALKVENLKSLEMRRTYNEFI